MQSLAKIPQNTSPNQQASPNHRFDKTTHSTIYTILRLYNRYGQV
jgi:hypothetical protein